MTTTSRGLGTGAGPTPASSRTRERIMSGKVHGRGGSCGGRDDVAAPNAGGDQERARDDHGAREKRHARAEALVRETRPDGPDHAGDAPQGLLHPQHQSVLVLVRAVADERDRKSTRLNSSHLVISYAVFCLKKKKHKTKSNNHLTI